MELERLPSLPNVTNKQGQALSHQGSARLGIISVSPKMTETG